MPKLTVEQVDEVLAWVKEWLGGIHLEQGAPKEMLDSLEDLYGSFPMVSARRLKAELRSKESWCFEGT